MFLIFFVKLYQVCFRNYVIWFDYYICTLWFIHCYPRLIINWIITNDRFVTRTCSHIQYILVLEGKLNKYKKINMNH